MSHKLPYSYLFDNLQQMAASQTANEMVEVRVSPEKVWEVWEKAHAQWGSAPLKKGQRGNRGKFQYEIVESIPNKKFTLLWKTLFVRLIFSHEVKATQRGSQIFYQVDIKGVFAWPIRWMLGNKIRQNISFVLKAVVKQLESES